MRRRPVKTLDPVALKEGKVRATRRVSASMKLERATDALLWFHEYATEGEGAALRTVKPSALVGENGFGGPKCPNLVSASSTHGVEFAAPYLAAAYKSFRAEIIARAIELAQADLAQCEEDLK